MANQRLVLTVFLFLLILSLATAASISAAAQSTAKEFNNIYAQTTQSGPVATEAQIARALDEWSQTSHSNTFDDGMGANTTCARCKSPLNWDPSQELAQQQALDCGSCKRVPGAPRPNLNAGVDVSEDEWLNIGCEVCHQPVGDSFSTSISFWNQALGQYEEVENTMELCAKCHEGRHGFHVIEEQEVSPAHQGWDCTVCHGAHSSPSQCVDCHTPTTGRGSDEHKRHPSVNCTGCHDEGRLTVWQDPEQDSPHYGSFITRRFAHTITSWPSHNLSADVDCTTCHHPQGDNSVSAVPEVSCEACHEEGAVLFWCEYFTRDPDPTSLSIEPKKEP